MTIKLFFDKEDTLCVIYDSSTEMPLSRIILARRVRGENLTASEVAEKFLAWSLIDIRKLSQNEFELHWCAFQEYLDTDITHEIIGGKQ